MQQSSRETPLGVYTARALNLISDSIRFSSELTGAVRQLASNEIVYRDPGKCIRGTSEPLFMNPAIITATLAKCLKKHAKDLSQTLKLGFYKSRDEVLFQGCIRGCEVLIDKLKGADMAVLAEKYGEDAVSSVIGEELDPLRTAAVGQLVEQRQRICKAALDDIEAFTKTRYAERDRDLVKIDQELAILRDPSVSYSC